METAWIYALGSVVIVSIVSFIGLLTFYFSEKTLGKIIPYTLSLAAGAMLGNALLHLMPEAIAHLSAVDNSAAAHAAHDHGHDHDHADDEHEHNHAALHEDAEHDNDAHAGHNHAGHDHSAHSGLAHHHGGPALFVTSMVLLGVMLFFAADLLLHSLGHCCTHQVVKPVGWLLTVGDGLENFMDGVIIGAAYLISVPVGVATTIAVFIHEIPIELGDFGVLLHSGFSKKRALLVNGLSAGASLFGCLLALEVGSSFTSFLPYVAPLAAGAFLYMAGSSLLPTVKHETLNQRSAKHFVCVLAGIGMMALLLLVAH
ncbi:MAG: ZIP family metal transporter [Candidatus Obscuribacterales bacterium]|nr:ZIP family metal transporter [Candidatus Obscuribacterales bacterium]